MASTTTGRRYGSPADLAECAGLSVKTIRRMVDDGTIPGHKVGRRVLIAYEDLERHIHRIDDYRRPSVMATALTIASPYRSVDARGRALPMTAEEIRGRAETIARGLDALDEIGEEGEQGQTLDLLMKAIDEDRLSDRKRFS